MSDIEPKVQQNIIVWMAGNNAVHGTNVVDSGVYGIGIPTGTTPDTARTARGSAKPHPIHTPHGRICSAAATPGEDCRDVRFEADARMAAGMRGGFVPDYNDLDLYQIHMDAEAAEGGHPRRAGAICMGLTESLGVHYNMIDGGAFWPLFGECVEAIGRCIRRQDPPAAERRRRIEYLAGWSLVVFSDFAEYYERELRGCAPAWAA